MRSPRRPWRGLTGAEANKSFGNDSLLLPQAAPICNDRLSAASRIDRLADVLLFEGRHAVAERLSHRAHAMRQAVPFT
jgi:hypothetical protein